MCPDFRGGAKKQPVPWPGGPGYNGAYVYIYITCTNIYIHSSLGVDWKPLVGIDGNTKKARIGVDQFILVSDH